MSEGSGCESAWSWDHGPGDDQLLEMTLGGREHAFDILVARHGPRVRRLLRRLTGSSDEAEDLTQEVFIRVYKGASRRRLKTNFRVWLYRITRSVAIDFIRRERTRRRARARRVEPRRPAPEAMAPLLAREFRERLDAALARLPEAFRTAFVLREIEEMSYAEIAAVLRTSEKTVSTRLHRARLRLRAELADLIDGELDGRRQRRCS